MKHFHREMNVLFHFGSRRGKSLEGSLGPAPNIKLIKRFNGKQCYYRRTCCDLTGPSACYRYIHLWHIRSKQDLWSYRSWMLLCSGVSLTVHPNDSVRSCGIRRSLDKQKIAVQERTVFSLRSVKLYKIDLVESWFS